MGLEAWQLWNLTPREYYALENQWRDAHLARLKPFAELQATLHNVHFRGQLHPQAFTADDFMPNRKPQTVEDKVATMMAWKEALSTQQASTAIKQRQDEVVKTEPEALSRWEQLKRSLGKT